MNALLYRIVRRRTVWIVTLSVLSACLLSARACQTPVYRYAMYKWSRAPYEVIYIHDGKQEDQDKAVNAALRALAEDDKKPVANLRFSTFDASNKTQIESAFPAIKETLDKNKKLARPFHVVHTPDGYEVFAGRLTVDALKSLAESPARKKINKLLAGGAPCVMVVLQGPDAKQNQQADKAIATVIKKAAEGLYTPPAEPEDPFGLPKTPDPSKKKKDGAEAGKTEEKKPESLAIATVTVSRDDPQEQWFVRCLLQAERDLHKFPKDTMVFAAYGRGRVIEPCINKGITEQNLADYVSFVMGACSCQVKEQNPGMDLLNVWDWDTAAEKLAERYGSETGNEQLLGDDEFLSLLIGPTIEDKPAKGDKPNEKPAPDGRTRTQGVTPNAGDSSNAADDPLANLTAVNASNDTSATSSKATGPKTTTLAATALVTTDLTGTRTQPSKGESPQTKEPSQKKTSDESDAKETTTVATVVPAVTTPVVAEFDEVGVLQNLGIGIVVVVAVLIVLVVFFLRPTKVS